jgi:hypothetical protein
LLPLLWLDRGKDIFEVILGAKYRKKRGIVSRELQVIPEAIPAF